MTTSAVAADTVIIGGGIMGLAIALEVAETGGGHVVLIEECALGAGSSGRSGAILRAHYSHPVTIAMAWHGVQSYGGFAGRTGLDIGFRESGMFLLAPPEAGAGVAANAALMRGLGVPVEVLDARGIARIEPRLRVPEGWVAAYEPRAGYVDPVRTLGAYAAWARRLGVEILIGDPVEGFLGTPTRVTGVRLGSGAEIPARQVVNCAGAWARRLCASLAISVELPLVARRPQQAFFELPADHGRPLPIVCDLGGGIYWKGERGTWTRVGNLSYDDDEVIDDPDRLDESVSHDFLAACRAAMTARVTGFESAIGWGGCAAIYTVTPDALPLIGPAPGVEGLWLCSGWSGHGFKMGPAVGRGVAACLAGRDPSPFDPALFVPTRFAAGHEYRGAHAYRILG